MPTQQTLCVYANPYHQWDHEGRPSGAFAYEPQLPREDTHVRYVGAKLVATLLRKEDTARGIKAMHDHSFEFSSEPVVLPNSDYYRRAIKTGQLVAVDLATWKAAGGQPKEFEDPKKVLAAAKATAIAEHVAHYDEEPVALVAHEMFDTKPTRAAAKPPAPTPAAPAAKE